MKKYSGAGKRERAGSADEYQDQEKLSVAKRQSLRN